MEPRWEEPYEEEEPGLELLEAGPVAEETEEQRLARDHARVMSASILIGDKVVNPQGQELGAIEEIMINVAQGRVSYAVLSFGGVVGVGDKLFAIPWQALRLDPHERRFVLDVPKDKLASAPGFDRDDWPDMADPEFIRSIYTHYGYDIDWEI